MKRQASKTADAGLVPGSLGITIEIQEYRPATGDVVTVVPLRRWAPSLGGVLRECAPPPAVQEPEEGET